MKSEVLRFYQQVFGARERDGLLQIDHPAFSHPVVTPRFLLTDQWPVSSPDWFSRLGDPLPGESSAGYRRLLSGYYLFFGSRFEGTPDGVRVHEGVSPEWEESHRRALCDHVTGMDALTLKRVEEVLQNNRGNFQRMVAADSAQGVLGSLTTLQGPEHTLVALGWVHKDHCRRGIMKALLNRVLELHVTRKVFAWTFNPVLYGTGQHGIPLTVYQRSPRGT